MKLDKYFKKGKIIVSKENFAILKSRNAMPGSFAVIKFKDEITCVIDAKKIIKKYALKTSKDWKIVTFDIQTPLELVGFMAKISERLAKEKIAVNSLSAYSRDHILVRKQDISKAIKVLRKLGFKNKT